MDPHNEAKSIDSIIGSTFSHIGLNNNDLPKSTRTLLHSRRVPDSPWSELNIEIWMRTMASMDCNNKPNAVGVGEREGRVFSSIVSRRHYGFSHGIGRSGDLAALQPKAPGSALMVSLTTSMVEDLLRRGCGIQSMIGSPLITPVATGLSMSLCLQTLKKTSETTPTRILFSRIDQKSGYKAVHDQGLKVDSIPQVMVNGNYETDIAAMERLIGQHGPESYLAIVTCTSCFAPRNPDDVVGIADLCSRRNIPHVVNNAYGLTCTKTTQALQDGCRTGRIDYCVQSLDKNLMVPVSGAIVFSNQESRIKDLSKFYPGRASGSHIIDLHITLLEMGMNKWTALRKERKAIFDKVNQGIAAKFEQLGLKKLTSSSNKISLAFTLPSSITGFGTEIGSRLYYRGISGLRFVSKKTNQDTWGAHGLWRLDDEIDIMIFAVAIGCCESDYLALVEAVNDQIETVARGS